MPAYFEQGFSVREPMWHGLGTILDEYPGREQAMRAAGRASTPMASLSRSFGAVRGRTLILCLPGSPRGALECAHRLAQVVLSGMGWEDLLDAENVGEMDVYCALTNDEENNIIWAQRLEDVGVHVSYGVAGLILLVIGVAGNIGRWRLGRHGLLALLLVVQLFLAWLGYEVPEVFGFLHPLNALFIFAVAGWIAWAEWKSCRRGRSRRWR